MPQDLVLCVDDEPIVLRSCSLILSEAGFRAVVADSGPAGLSLFRRYQPEICLVLADVVMPGEFNGVEMARRILQVDPAARVLLMTGYTDDVIPKEWRDVLPLIRKPFLGEDLVLRIRSVLGRSDAAANTAPA